MADDAPNGQELREKLAVIDARLASLERLRHSIYAWLGTVSAGVVVSIIIAWLRH